MFLKTIFLIAIFSVSPIAGLSLTTIYHMQSLQSQQAYLDNLIQIETDLQTKINFLSSLSNSINQNISSLEEYPSTQSSALEAGLSAERTVIYEASSLLVFPLEKRTWDCSLLTQEQAKTINQEISQSQKTIAALKQKTELEKKCQRNVEISNQIINLNIYIDHLAKQVGSNCAQNETAKTFLVPNSQNQNFVYGKEGQESYNKKIQNMLDQGFTKLECPIDAPFPKGNTCVGCPKDKTHYFDLSQNVCLTCPDSYQFQPSNHTCVRQMMNSNPSANNYYGNVPNPIEGAETCPSEAPFFNGTNCIGCNSPAFFDFTSNLCKKCPENTTFDTSTHLCIYKKFNSNISPETTNFCCGNPTQDSKSETCPKETPYFNGKSCISCASPAFFNFQSLTCELCSEQQGFSIKQKKCIDSKYLQPKYTSILPESGNYMGKPSEIDTSFENVQKCPENKPYSDGNSCVECSLPKFWNFQDNKCEICSDQKSFDPKSQTCLSISTKKMNNNMLTLNNFIGQIPDYNPNLSTCPEESPFFNGESCISCALPKFANLNNLACESCNNGFTFTLANRQCLADKPSAFTDMQAGNIFYTGNWTELVREVDEKKKANPELKACSSDKPFFNAQTNSCISCTSEFPLFDYKYNRCIGCSGGSQFNPDRKICVLGGRVSATVERMIMNTVGWV